MVRLKNNKSRISACLDSNVIISAIAFGGIPYKILDRALCREFHLVMGQPIFDEVKKNLIGKLGLNLKLVNTVLSDIEEISSIFVPQGTIDATPNAGDNLVLEI